MPSRHASRNTREHAAGWAREPHRLQELHATRAIADEGSVGLREVPRREPLFLWQPVEKRLGLGVVQRQECEFFSRSRNATTRAAKRQKRQPASYRRTGRRARARRPHYGSGAR